jgi:hypothetical protein
MIPFSIILPVWKASLRQRSACPIHIEINSLCHEHHLVLLELWNTLSCDKRLQSLFAAEFNKDRALVSLDEGLPVNTSMMPHLELAPSEPLHTLGGVVLSPFPDGIDVSKLLKVRFQLFLRVRVRVTFTESFLQTLSYEQTSSNCNLRRKQTGSRRLP